MKRKGRPTKAERELAEIEKAIADLSARRIELVVAHWFQRRRRARKKA